MKFIKIPLEIEALQFKNENKDIVFNWMRGNCCAAFEEGLPILEFMTIHGDKAVARIGDWIVEDGAPGTYYPVKPDIFAKTYKAV